MRFIQELGNPSGWAEAHRLVCIKDDGTRVESAWSKTGYPVFLQDTEIATNGAKTDEYSLGGYVCFAEEYGAMPRVARYDWQESTAVVVDAQADSNGIEEEANDEEFVLKEDVVHTSDIDPNRNMLGSVEASTPLHLRAVGGDGTSDRRWSEGPGFLLADPADESEGGHPD